MKFNELKPADYNPRQITDEQLQRLKKSLQEFGDLSGIVFNRRTGNLVGGHQRLKCLPPDVKIEKKDLKEKSKTGTVAQGFIILEGEKYTYREVEWDEQKEKQANIAANKHGGEWDDEKLASLLQEFSEMPDFDPDLIGFETKEMDELISQITGKGQIDDDEVPEVDAEPITKTGDLYILGNHRLLCGDATKKEDVERLMDGKKADMVFTDPPYGVGYADKNKFLNAIAPGNRIQRPIKSDHENLEDMTNLWLQVFSNMYQHTKNGGTYYICSPQGKELMMMMMSIKDAKWQFGQNLIWAKNNHVLGRSDYHYKHEPIFYGWKEGGHKFYGSASETSVWEIARPIKSDLHPTMKPVELIERAILNSSLHQQIILDLFLGSGSTLIACEKTNRICFGMEIDAHYCDVIVTRYCKYTGNNKIIRNGKKITWQLPEDTKIKPQRRKKNENRKGHRKDWNNDSGGVICFS